MVMLLILAIYSLNKYTFMYSCPEYLVALFFFQFYLDVTYIPLYKFKVYSIMVHLHIL